MVVQHGFGRGASTVSIVFDKPEYLSKVRDALHDERKKRPSTRFLSPQQISDNDKIPRGKQYSEGLTNKYFKALLLDYISIFLVSMAKIKLNPYQTVIVDSPTFDKVPMCVKYGQVLPLAERENNKGDRLRGLVAC